LLIDLSATKAAVKGLAPAKFSSFPKEEETRKGDRMKNHTGIKQGTKRIALLVLVSILLVLFTSQLLLAAQAETNLPAETYPSAETKPPAETKPETVRAKILDITENTEKEQEQPIEASDGFKITYYKVQIKVLSGKHKGEILDAEHIVDQRMVYNLQVAKGDEVLVYLEADQQGKITNAFIAEIYREKYLIYLGTAFLLTLVVFGRLKGLKTIVTLGITGIAVIKVLLPGLLKGYNPVLLTVGTCTVVATLTLFLISGINRKTISAILGTTGGVLAAGIIAMIFGSLAKLTGLGEQETQMLAYIPQNTGFDFKGLLFAGIILGALGAVMDIGMSIASSMNEIEAIKPEIQTKELIDAGMNVGKDIMGTMSNTLILAYAGASLPLLLLFLANDIPFNEYINWDMISSEIVRALAGSIGLILTIPLTALITAALRSKQRKPREIRRSLANAEEQKN
jgi:uncharacterized membrane protein